MSKGGKKEKEYSRFDTGCNSYFVYRRLMVDLDIDTVSQKQ